MPSNLSQKLSLKEDFNEAQNSMKAVCPVRESFAGLICKTEYLGEAIDSVYQDYWELALGVEETLENNTFSIIRALS